MLKKVLLTIVAVLVAGGALMIYGTYKAVDETLKGKEPQLRQYMQMDEVAQNQYILDNFSEIMAGVDLDKDGKPEDREDFEKFMRANENPEIKQQLVDVGRSFMATAIMMSDGIAKDISADIEAKYQKEVDELEARIDKYLKSLEAAGVKVE